MDLHWPMVPGLLLAAPAQSPDLTTSLNLAWVLLCGFLIFFMQAGFAMVETGMVRAKNVAHTMAMNVVIFCVGTLGFWVCGFALMFGSHGAPATLGGGSAIGHEVGFTLVGKTFGLFGTGGFFLAGQTLSAGVLALFLFQVMFMDTAATIPTGVMAERWKFAAFVLFGFAISAVIYPVFGHWVWGGGWLARLGANFGLGHGCVDFAGSSVVHMTGGIAGLVGTIMLGPRLGKFLANGRPNPMPAHNVPMYMVGTLFLAFGWFGFNAGSTLSATDANVARIAVNTVLASAAGAMAAMLFMWRLYHKPDPSFVCNGLLAGLVSITGGCAYVEPWAAVIIGGVGGALAVWSALLLERRWRLDDPVGAVSVHGVGGAWGILAVGLLADGTYAPSARFNGVAGHVTGVFYGDASQLAAQAIGLLANVCWVLPTAYVCFRLIEWLVGNRVSAPVEFQGLDVPEMGAVGYILQDLKAPESRAVVQVLREPRSASVPPNGNKRFWAIVEGPDTALLAAIWSELCQVTEQPPPPEFRAVYPYMTTLQGNRFRFRGGNPEVVSKNLEALLQQRLHGQDVRITIES